MNETGYSMYVDLLTCVSDDRTACLLYIDAYYSDSPEPNVIYVAESCVESAELLLRRVPVPMSSFYAQYNTRALLSELRTPSQDTTIGLTGECQV